MRDLQTFISDHLAETGAQEAAFCRAAQRLSAPAETLEITFGLVSDST